MESPRMESMEASELAKKRAATSEIVESQLPAPKRKKLLDVGM